MSLRYCIETEKGISEPFCALRSAQRPIGDGESSKGALQMG